MNGMNRTIWSLLAAMCALASLAEAQTKPLGVFDPGPAPPAWASIGTLADWDDFAAARDLSERRGMRWLLHLGYAEDPRVPIAPHAERVRDRLRADGLLPYVAAVNLGEEWYEHCLAGAYAAYGLPVDSPACVPVVRDWLGHQQAQVARVFARPVVWLTTMVHPVWRPVPAHTTVVALDPYYGPGGSFDSTVAPILALAERSTTLPLVLIPQWFRAPSGVTPRAADVAKYFDWLARPQWIALLGFSWSDRAGPHGLTGLESLPSIQRAIEREVVRP
jgi:hypothetical protein